MSYSSFPMQYSPAPIGLIPVELDIEGLYEDHDRRRRKGGSDKVVASHVHSVSPILATSDQKAKTQTNTSHSAEEHRTELRKERSEIGKKSTCASSRRD